MYCIILPRGMLYQIQCLQHVDVHYVLVGKMCGVLNGCISESYCVYPRQMLMFLLQFVFFVGLICQQGYHT